MTRTERIRTALGETQSQFAARLGVNQSTVDRLEGGARESGPVAKLLDLIEAALPSADTAASPPPDAPFSRFGSFSGGA